MSLFSRTLARLQPTLGLCSRASAAPSRALTRSLVVLSSNANNSKNRREIGGSTLCSCGCGSHGMHTRGDRELVEFLQEEISAEKKSMVAGVPSHLDDFKISTNDAEMTLTKSFHDEQITISLNVNHTVDSEPVDSQNQDVDLKSRPSFEVDMIVGSKTMSFTCTYLAPGEGAGEGGEGEDTFGINELTIYSGEWGEETYCVSGDILDGMMYDLLMNLLEERGVSNEFAEKLSNLCSDYEHAKYVGLLEKVQDFIKRK